MRFLAEGLDQPLRLRHSLRLGLAEVDARDYQFVVTGQGEPRGECRENAPDERLHLLYINTSYDPG